MKKKIADQLRTKYQRFGLSNEAIDRIASAKEKTVTSDDQIEAAIADAETMELIATELQKSADVERRKASDIQKSFDDYKTAHPEKTDPDPDQKTPPADPNEPEWARKLREQNEKVLEENRKIQDEFTRRDNAKRLELAEANVRAALEKAGCTNPGFLNATMKGFTLGENETEEQAVVRLTAEYNQLFKEAVGDGSVTFRGSAISTRAEVNADDRAKQARDDAARVRKS